MSEGKPRAQPAVQAGSPGKTAPVGSVVGVLRSSDDAPVMGGRAKAGYLSERQRRIRRMTPLGICLTTSGLQSLL
jgi:hypothetical protein